MEKRNNRIPHVEIRSGKRFYVVRNSKGNILASRKVTKAAPSLARIKEIYLQNATFFENIKKVRLTRVTETTIIQPSKFKPELDKRTGEMSVSPYDMRPVRGFKPKTIPQYQVTGVVMINNKSVEIHRRSMKLGSPECPTAQACHDYAWVKFLEEVGKAYGVGYDDDRGLHVVDKVQNITEGWVYYS